MAHIELDRVSLTFRIRKLGRITFKEFLVRRLYRRSVNPVVKVRALRDVSLSISEGERIGILGHNGAGKSTLLKLMAGIYPPTRGRRVVEGRVSSLFDIALGFEPDASGYENIHYRGYLQGETPRTIAAKLPAIADFSELGDFLNMPVRYYSSGMLVRLAFSIATAIEPEILLLDEVFGAGDMAFQLKAKQRMREMARRARLIVMVSHDLNALCEMCDKGIWLDHGSVREIGPIEEMAASFTAAVHGSWESRQADAAGPTADEEELASAAG